MVCSKYIIRIQLHDIRMHASYFDITQITNHSINLENSQTDCNLPAVWYVDQCLTYNLER